MNQRLESAYASLRAGNRQAVLNNQVMIDTLWGRPVWGVPIHIDLSDSLQREVTVIQRDLDELEPGNLYFPQPFHQHISLSQVIFWGGEYAHGREVTWEYVKEDFIRAFRGLDGTYPSFPITFSELIPTRDALIWCAFDEHDELETLRRHLRDSLPFPEETTKVNTIIHTTVARYKNKLRDPKRIIDYCTSQKQSAGMTVRTLSLKKELVFPAIKTELIAEIRLA